jgi:ketol-acid reductoisomerase
MSDPFAGKTVAVVGFGNQGEAQARLLAHAGTSVLIGARAGGPSEARARAQGFRTATPAEAARQADVLAVLVPDESIPLLWSELTAAASAHTAFVFAHGFALMYGAHDCSAVGDVVLVSPTGPGSLMAPGRPPVAGYLAVHRDSSGNAWSLAEAWADGLGITPRHRTTVREETEVDLFGEQVVLCGGLNALVTAAFETLVARGYSPVIAYLECVHQLKYLADLLHARGIAGFREAISRTALYGDLTRGPRVVGAASREAMSEILEEVRSGAFAREWTAEVAAGTPRLEAAVREAGGHPIEEARRRALET